MNYESYIFSEFDFLSIFGKVMSINFTSLFSVVEYSSGNYLKHFLDFMSVLQIYESFNLYDDPLK